MSSTATAPSSPKPRAKRPRSSGVSPLAYPGAWAAIVLAVAFPIALMVFDPELMFERGWEQYAGTGIFLWALFMLGGELLRLSRDEKSFASADIWLDAAAHGKAAESIKDDDHRVLPARIRQLAVFASEAKSASVSELMEINREASGLDQEHASGRFMLGKYILYLLPVIGFIGTVEGISKALMNISRVLPMVKELDGFMSNLTGVTSALQVAFDSTLLALFLSASLMFVMTLVHRRCDDLLARVDRWVVENALPRLGSVTDPTANRIAEAIRGEIGQALAPAVVALQELSQRLGDGFGPHVERFSQTVDRIPGALSGLQKGADSFSRLGEDLAGLGAAEESLRRGVASLSRIEATLANPPGDHLDDLRRGLDRACAAIETLSQSFSQSFERSSRANQEQLAKTLHSLKDALDLLNVSMEQGNVLYRSIVKKMLPVYSPSSTDERAA